MGPSQHWWLLTPDISLAIGPQSILLWTLARQFFISIRCWHCLCADSPGSSRWMAQSQAPLQTALECPKLLAVCFWLTRYTEFPQLRTRVQFAVLRKPVGQLIPKDNLKAERGYVLQEVHVFGYLEVLWNCPSQIFTGPPLHRLDSVDRKNVLGPHKPHLQWGDDVQSEEWTLSQHHLCRYWVKNVQSLSLWFNVLIYLIIAKLWGKGNHRTVNHHKALRRAT